MDTPGLLQRPDDFRNKMELLTLAALQHLPSSVLFVADLTEECGTSVADQWAIRCELRARFPAKPWVDVLSKADLLQDVWRQAEALQQQQAADAAGCAGPAEVQSAAGFAAALPAAVRVSSLTEEGLVHLQQRIAAMLQTQAAVQQLADAAAADAAAAAADAAAAAAQQTLLPPQQ
jgi:nucleolar GTP-binding protein